MFSDVFAQFETRLNLSHSRTGIHDPSARMEAISTVDRGIDTAKQFVRSLLTRRNALVPISLLPPEILAWVFHLLALKEPPFSGRRELGWIRVTHVCRHWREVALDNSSLWAKITCGMPTNTKWMSEILARAKNTLLDIEFHTLTETGPEALFMIPPHLSHTRQLRGHMCAPHSDCVREIYCCEAPALEHFKLTSNSYSPIPFPDLGGNMLFKGRAPRLRTFSLSHVVIPWSLVPRGQITQLKIVYPESGDPEFDEDDYSSGNLNQLIDLLVNCPALETLVLDSCLPSQLTEHPHYRTIHLPHLSYLRIRDSTSRIMSMLKMLKLPSSTTLQSLHLDCISEITPIHDSEGPLLALISAQFQCPVPVKFKSLTATIESRTTSLFYIRASTFPSTLLNRQAQNIEGDIVGNAELVLSFDRLSKPGHSMDLLEQACKMLPISSLQFISVSATNLIDINWVELFGCCTNVISMQAIGHGTSSLVRALTAPTVTNAGSSKGGRKRNHGNREMTLVQPASTVAHAHTAIFPNLMFLELTGLEFMIEHPLAVPFNVFKRGLQQRMAASGEPLKFLRFKKCDIIDSYAIKLRKLVEVFEWDKYEAII